MTVDEARAAVIAGDGVVARFPGLLCVARGPDRDAVARLLEVCASVAGTDPGRPLARRLARWLGGLDAPDDDLVFGTLASAGDQLGVFLVGATSISVAGSSVVLSGADAATWTDRLIPLPHTPVVLALEGTVPPSGIGTGPNDLRAGVVPGAGAVLFAGLADRRPHDAPAEALGARAPAWFTDERDVHEPEPVAVSEPVVVPESVAVSEPVTVPEPVALSEPAPGRPDGNGLTDHAPPAPEATNGHVDLAVPAWSEQAGNGSGFGGRHAILDVGAVHVDDGRPGLLDPGRGTAGPPTLPGDDPAAPVSLVRPATDSTLFVEAAPPPPRAAAVEAAPAGLPLPRRTSLLPTQRGRESAGMPVAGSRLPLGRIVFDDGATFTVDGPYLVGRMPESDPRARSGELRPIVLDDDTGSVSRVHAEILIRGWDVVLVDSGSRNGTFVAGPDESAWTALGPGRTSRLVPGTRVRLGARTFVFEPGTVEEIQP